MNCSILEKVQEAVSAGSKLGPWNFNRPVQRGAVMGPYFHFNMINCVKYENGMKYLLLSEKQGNWVTKLYVTYHLQDPQFQLLLSLETPVQPCQVLIG